MTNQTYTTVTKNNPTLLRTMGRLQEKTIANSSHH